MPTWPEITRSLYGAWRLAHFDSGGMNYFDLFPFLMSELNPLVLAVVADIQI